MKKVILMAMLFIVTLTSSHAQDGSNRISLSTGVLYERGLDLTLSYEHETKYHNAWEYFWQCVSEMG